MYAPSATCGRYAPLSSALRPISREMVEAARPSARAIAPSDRPSAFKPAIRSLSSAVRWEYPDMATPFSVSRQTDTSSALGVALHDGTHLASGLGIGLSTIGNWVRALSDEARPPGRIRIWRVGTRGFGARVGSTLPSRPIHQAAFMGARPPFERSERSSATLRSARKISKSTNTHQRKCFLSLFLNSIFDLSENTFQYTDLKFDLKLGNLSKIGALYLK